MLRYFGQIENDAVSSNSREHGHNGLKISAKLCLSLFLLKWLKSKCNLSSNLTPVGSKTPYASFSRGLIKDKSFL